MTKRIFPALLLCSAAFLAATAYAATRPKPVTLPLSDIFQSGTTACGRVGGKWIPGITASSKPGVFTSRAAQLRALKRDQLLASSDAARAKVEKKIVKLQKRQRTEARTCSLGPTPTPTVTPTGAPIVPTATPPPQSQGCYDPSRNTSCFGIPNGQVGNENQGLALFTSSCAGCHNGSIQTEPRDKTYSQIEASFSSVPSMNLYIGSFSSNELSDLTAYLNRFNPNQ